MSPPEAYPVALAAYALLLVAIATAMELLARHTHRRSDRFRTLGFTYHHGHDAWVCPEDQWLWPHEYDHERRLMRYRARPLVCNACPTKHACTDSDEGREIVRSIDPWPHSEAARFHRGMALVPLALALPIVGVGFASRPNPAGLLVLAVPTLLSLVLGWLYLRTFRRTPANPPPSVQRVPVTLSRPSRWASQRRNS